MDRQEYFEDAGFLSRAAWRDRHNIRAGNREWFQLDFDLNSILMKIISAAMRSNPGFNWDVQAVAIRLLMRTAVSFQGVIKLSELGMLSPARTLVRTIVEDSFCAAKLDKNPGDIIDKLIKESNFVRKKQADFILNRSLFENHDGIAEFKEAVSKMQKEKKIDWKAEAINGELWRQYLNYMRLSDDSVHTSALSLDRHLSRNDEGTCWSLKFQKGDDDEITATLHRAVLATVPIGIVVTNVLEDVQNNGSLRALCDRFQKLPDGRNI